MKQKKGFNLVIISLVILGIAVMPFLNFSSSESTTLNIETVLDWIKDKHIVRLYELTLTGGADNTVTLKIDSSNAQLKVSNGIVAGSDSNTSTTNSDFSSIGGGDNNSISDSINAGIAGGKHNTIINGENSVIGGGNDNYIDGKNAVIAGGNGNSAGNSGVVAGGKNNTASNNGVALGGQNNKAGDNSLVMGSGAEGTRAFARNAKASQESARIDTKNGVLIGTTEAIAGVNLVVNGAIKIAGDNSNEGIPGEIKVVNGCFYAYDGNYRHVISQTNDPENCKGFVSTEACKFGNVRLQQGDQVTGYQATLDRNCNGKKVICSGGVLVTNTNDTSYNQPYCHKTS